MENNLINLRDRSPEERKEIAVKGGSARTEAKAIANIPKNMKSGKYAKKLSLTIKELAGNPGTSAIKIFDLIERISDSWETLSPQLKIQLARLYCEAHRTIHGTKTLSVNLNTELKKDLERWFRDEEDREG